MDCPDDITFKQQEYGSLHLVTMYRFGTEIKSCKITPRDDQTDEQAIQHAKDVLLYWYDRKGIEELSR